MGGTLSKNIMHWSQSNKLFKMSLFHLHSDRKITHKKKMLNNDHNNRSAPLEITFLIFGIIKWIYLPSRLTTWLQQQSAEVTSIAGCVFHCNVDRWLELVGRCPLLMNVTLQRKHGEEREPESLVSAEISESWPEFKHTDTRTHIHPQCALLLS